MSDPHEYDPEIDERCDEDGEFGFTEEDCGRWHNGRLGVQCRLAGTEDCDWECPIGLPSRGGKASAMTCIRCNGARTISHPNPTWTPETPRQATETTGPHGRPLTPCKDCDGSGER